MIDKLPDELHWNVIKYLRHPICEIFMKTNAYNNFLASKEDTYTDEYNQTFEINDLIPFYDIWRSLKLNNKKYIFVYKAIKVNYG